MKKPYSIARGLLATLVVLLLAIACGGTKKEVALPAGSRVLALGDSLTAPHGIKPGEDWPTLLAQKTGWVVINAGISGDTSAGALGRLPGLLEEHQPQLVLVSLGGNDMLRKLPQAQTVANLGRMLDLAKASGAKTVLLATPKPSITGAVFNNLSPADFYADVAKDKKVPLIADALPEVLSDTALKSDQLHPNAAGHALLAEKIHADLKKIGFAR
jgi:lysophospholipase L1-like esterase